MSKKIKIYEFTFDGEIADIISGRIIILHFDENQARKEAIFTMKKMVSEDNCEFFCELEENSLTLESTHSIDECKCIYVNNGMFN